MAREKDARAPLPDLVETVFFNSSLDTGNYYNCARCGELITSSGISLEDRSVRIERIIRVPLIKGELYSYAHADCEGPMPRLWGKVRAAEDRMRCEFCPHMQFSSVSTSVVPEIYPVRTLVQLVPAGVCKKYDKKFHKLDRKNARAASGWCCINPHEPSEASKWVRVSGYASDKYPCTLGLNEQLELVTFSGDYLPPIDIREADSQGFQTGKKRRKKPRIEESLDDEGSSGQYESQFDWISSRLSPSKAAPDGKGEEEDNWFPYPCDIATRNEDRVSLGDAFPAADIYDDEEEQLPADLKIEKEDGDTTSVYARWLAKIRLHPDLAKLYPCRLFVDPLFVPGSNPRNIQPKRFPYMEPVKLVYVGRDGMAKNFLSSNLHGRDLQEFVLAKWLNEARLRVRRQLKNMPPVPGAELNPMLTVQNPDGTDRKWVDSKGKTHSTCYSVVPWIQECIENARQSARHATPGESTTVVFGECEAPARMFSDTRRNDMNERPILPPSSIAEIARTTDVRLVGYRNGKSITPECSRLGMDNGDYGISWAKLCSSALFPVKPNTGKCNQGKHLAEPFTVACRDCRYEILMAEVPELI